MVNNSFLRRILMKPKMNIFKQYFYAITNPKKYGDMAKLGAGRVFLYLLILSLFSTICTFTPAIVTYFRVGGVEKLIDNYIPDFSFKNGTLKTELKISKSFDMESLEEELNDASLDDIYDEEVIENIRNIMLFAIANNFSEIDFDQTYDQVEMQLKMQEINEELTEKLQEESFYLYVDTSVTSVSELIDSEELMLEEIEDDNVAIFTQTDFAVFDKNDINNAIENNRITSYPYASSAEISISKTDITDVIKDILPIMYVFVVIFIFIYIFAIIIGWLISSLIFAVLALIANAATHKHFTFGTLFKVSVYAHTTSIIICALLGLIPNEPPIISTLISWLLPILYIVLAILYMDDTPVVPLNNWNMYNQPYNGQNNPYNNMQQPPFKGQNNPYNNMQQPPFNGQNNPYNNMQQPPFNGQNNPYNNMQQPPFNGQNNPYNNMQQPPFNGQNNPYNNMQQPPFNGQNNPYNNMQQPPFNGQTSAESGNSDTSDSSESTESNIQNDISKESDNNNTNNNL